MSPEASSGLVKILTALQQVADRQQLLDWADAHLRRMVDFSSMACLMAEPHGRGFRIRDVIATGDVMHCMTVVEEADAAAAERPTPDTPPPGRGSGWHVAIADASHALIDRWMRDRCALQMSLSANRSGGGGGADVAPLLDCFGVETIALHGVKEAFSGSATFLLLGAARGGSLDPLALQVLDLVMPALHLARQRIYRGDRALGQHGSTVGLTAREIKILAMVAEGKTDEEAARSTGRSVHTIKNQVRHLVTKLGARNRAHAVLIAHHHDLLHVDA